MGKSKHTQASQEARARYDAKTYKLIGFRLRIEEDSDIISSIEEAKNKGLSNREWLREIFEGKK